MARDMVITVKARFTLDEGVAYDYPGTGVVDSEESTKAFCHCIAHQMNDRIFNFFIKELKDYADLHETEHKVELSDGSN